MKSERELFNLAKDYAMLEMDFQKPLPEYELDEIRDSMQEIRNVLLEKGYSVDRFIGYKRLYKKMSVAEYFEFIKTLE
jgi:hypothetical protein